MITVDYDAAGRKTGLHDPDLGWIQYNLNPLGQVYAQISPEQAAAGKKTWTAYDVQGRMTARYEPDLESHWIFDTAAKGIGQLAEADIGKGSLSDYRRTHSYDDFGRPGSTAQYMADSNGQYTLFIATPDYDVWGRLESQTYLHSGDSPKVFTQRYNAYGYLSRIQRGDLALWDVAGQDAANRVTSAVLGNGLTQNRTYNLYTARLEHAELITGSSVERLKETYLYDVLGNVTTRGQFWNGDGFLETFEYDALNRLKTSQVAGKGQQFYTYDAAGNIVTKTGLGTYRYPGQGNNAIQPHAVQGIDGVSGTYSYDKNGNLLVGGGRSYTWTSFDMPLTINKGSSASARFYYGPEHQRINQARSDGMVTYAGAQEVEPAPGGGVRLKTYWPNGLGVEIDQNGTTQVNWTHLDRLGSPVAMTGEDGATRADGKLEYDAWGKRRSVVDNNATDDSIDGKIDNRGFTGHEMLDQLDLVHMNGRVYDPLIGKFTSGDPLVSDPVNGQSYNRYAYVLNNPTNSTDPTGFEEEPGPELKRPATTLQGGGDWQVAYAAPGSSAGFSLVKPEKGAIGTAATRPDLSANNATGGVVGAKAATASDGTALGQLDIPKVIVQGFRNEMADFADHNRGVFGYWGWAAGLVDNYIPRPDNRSAEGKVSKVGLLALGMLSPSGPALKLEEEAAALAKMSIWSSKKGTSAVENAFEHWLKHSSEFPELQNAKQYAEMAGQFVTNPPAGALLKTRGQDTLIYDAATNTFGVRGGNGAPKTMFRPQAGNEYWNKQ